MVLSMAASEDLLEVPGRGYHPPASRQDSFTSSCGSFLSPSSQYDGVSEMGSCYDIVEEEATHQIKIPSESSGAADEIALDLLPTSQTSQRQYSEKQSSTTLSSWQTASNRGPLQRDNSTKEADPSGRIFR